MTQCYVMTAADIIPLDLPLVPRWHHASVRDDALDFPERVRGSRSPIAHCPGRPK